MSPCLPAKPHASRFTAFACALLSAAPAAAQSTRPDASALDTVVVRGLQPTSLPTHVPTTFETITGDEVRRTINATDAEDALKYFPSLLVRKRYTGDYDHAVLATRASGTGNSARSLVYADGILLSNLLGNGATFTPRWGLVSPEEIERVDVLYGPFSAAYPGNSAGAVVDFVTRMPTRFEAHARYGYSVEQFSLYGTDEAYPAHALSASIGHRRGRFAGWLALNRLDSQAHPIGFANVLAVSGTTGTGTPVTGAFAGANPRNQPWFLVGATGQTDTVQDQAKLKLAYDFTPHLRLSYVFGAWRNDAIRNAESYITDANGQPVHSGNVLIEGRRYAIAPTSISPQRADMRHAIHGLSLKHGGGQRWDYTLAASRYRYDRDLVRSPLVALPQAVVGGAGRIADSAGTGWRTANIAFAWRPGDTHAVEFGVQDDAYELRTIVFDTHDWISGAPQARVSAFAGTTELRSAYLQDTWRFAPRWTTVLGLRHEAWSARDGRLSNATQTLGFPRRSQSAWSPKAAIAFAGSGTWSIKTSIGRATRFPTVSELYQGTIATNAIVNNNPNLKPERSTTSELSWVRELDAGRLRATLFRERTRDALYAQTNVTVVPNVTSIQNVGRIDTRGVELAADFRDVGIDGFDVLGSVTFADSIIEENANFPASVGKWQPRVPRWRANLLATWQPGLRWSFTTGLRYGGEQFNTLDNSDAHSHAFTGTSPFFVVDARVAYRHDPHWSAALGVDNLADRTYWNFHPYNQRTWHMEVRFDH